MGPCKNAQTREGYLWRRFLPPNEKTLSNWLQEEGLIPPNGERIYDEAKAKRIVEINLRDRFIKFARRPQRKDKIAREVSKRAKRYNDTYVQRMDDDLLMNIEQSEDYGEVAPVSEQELQFAEIRAMLQLLMGNVYRTREFDSELFRDDYQSWKQAKLMATWVEQCADERAIDEELRLEERLNNPRKHYLKLISD